MDAYSGVELHVGEIRALRTFRVGAGGVLYPLFSPDPWMPGANAARCVRRRMLGGALSTERTHEVPGTDCTCGYYAYGSVEAASEYPNAEYVLAVVSCWGHLVAGTRGIRAQYARIDAIWMSPVVPADLADSVARRYPEVAVCADRNLMLSRYPPLALDCYEDEPVRRGLGIAPRLAILAALVTGVLPASWLRGNTDLRTVWLGELCLFALAAIVLRRRGNSDAQRRSLLSLAMVLWLLAPVAGAAGTLFVRLPLLQVAVLTTVHRRALAREARRFPARIVASPA
jgi:hypothetical protein